MTFGLYIYRNESYQEQTVDFYYDTASIAKFRVEQNDSMIDGTISLKDGKVALWIQDERNSGVNTNSYYESTSHIKYDEYIGGIWQFNTENNGIVDLEIKDISNGKMTFVLYSYRSQTYQEQTVDFYYDTASIAYFNIAKDDSMINGTISLKDGKVGLWIQSERNSGVNTNSYYESTKHIKYNDYVGGVWQVTKKDGTTIVLYITNISNGKITFKITVDGKTYKTQTEEFYYDTASIIHFDIDDEEIIGGTISLKAGKRINIEITNFQRKDKTEDPKEPDNGFKDNNKQPEQDQPNNNKLLGDVSCDGVVNGKDVVRLRKYLSNQVTLDKKALLNADLNEDGNVNESDLEILRNQLLISDDTEENNPQEEVHNDDNMTTNKLAGDVNCDGIVNGKDSVRLNKYLSGKITLDNQALLNADLNEDNSVNQDDAEILRQMLLNS